MMCERQREKLRGVYRGSDEWKKGWSTVSTEVDLIPLEDIPEGGICLCGMPTYKDYIDLDFTSSSGDYRRLIVRILNVPGYHCSAGCDIEVASLRGLTEAIEHAIPIFREKGHRNRVDGLEYTKKILSEIAAR